tara:strand:- start:160 stop:1101 length:942 start_codon:yes stop_codon:yes gene_type:complete
MLFTLFQEYDLRSNYDAYNYLSGYNFLSENPFNISGSRDFFGRYPEFIFVYFISIISIFGKINDVGIAIFFISSITFALIIYSYINVGKLYNKNFSKNALGLQLQLLSATIPLGLTVQLTRQSFAFFLFLSIIVLTRKIKLFSNIGALLAVVFTHFTSLFLVFGEFFIRYKKYFLLFIYFISVVSLLSYLVDNFTHINAMTRREDFKLFNFENIQNIDKYMVVTLVSLILIKGLQFLFDFRFLVFLSASILYLSISQEPTVTRIFFGAGWFWAIIIGIQLIGEKKLLKKKSLINAISYSIISIKIIILINRVI